MTLADSLAEEFEREAMTTRKHFERLPDAKLAWQPHLKSYTTGALASHILESIRWTHSIFKLTEVDFDPTTYKPHRAGSVSELLKDFDDEIAKCKQTLASVSDEDLKELWRLKVMGRQLFEKTRAAVFRDFVLSHIIHHRGQLSVYLRLLDLPVPGSYGPSADEQS